MSLKVGAIIAFERTFTPEDVALFSKISGDEGSHHVLLQLNREDLSYRDY